MLRSGVGPADEIKPHGLEVVHELAGVGRNRKTITGLSASLPVPAGNLHRSAWWRTQLAGVQYLLLGKGDASFPPTAAGAFLNRAMKSPCATCKSIMYP